MKDSISVLAFVLTLLVFQKVYVESYSLKCPSQGSWKIQAKSQCNSTLKYFCLYDNLRKRYVEGCKGPDWDRKGSKRIFSVSFTRGECTQKRYQPFRFQTNESMSDCIYAKSLCNEEGQIIYKDESSKNDRTCRCDYTRNYSFTITPKHVCYCIPTEEDCSCYIKACQLNFTLPTDYNCNPNGYKENPKCIDTIRDSKTIEEQIEVNTEKNNIYTEHRWTLSYVMLVLVCFICIFVIGAFYLATENLHQMPITVLNIAPQWLRKKLQSSERCIRGGQTDTDETDIRRTGSVKTLETEASYKSTTYDQTHGTEETDIRRTESANTMDGDFLSCEDADETNKVETESLSAVDRNDDEYCQRTTVYKAHVDDEANKEKVNVEVHKKLGPVKLTPNEVNYLRIIHLLFRVACPVVRMTFNKEIQPNQLRQTLDKKKAIIKKIYRKKEMIINRFQWNLLYGHVTGKSVISDDFDLSIMLHLLCTLANIEVGDLYPVKSDKRISAMLSRIKYIRNEVTQLYEGKLSENHFNIYWDDIAQAVFKLVSSYGIADDNEKNQLISRLHMLNNIDLDTDKLCTYICMSEKYPAKILQQIISEYCTLTKQTIMEILEKEKHYLYHKRLVTESCCVCNASGMQFCMFIKVIPEEQWDTLFKIKEGKDPHSCPSSLKTCCEHFTPKIIDTCDLSVTVPLILNIPDILTHIMNRIYKNKFDTFLMNNKHALYHSMERKRCCICVNDPTEKILINIKEWRKLFKKEDIVFCKTSEQDCCCHYSVINGIGLSHVDETLLSKIFHVAGPISVLNKIVQNAFLYFLNWSVDQKKLRMTIKELLNVIQDDKFSNDMLQQISSCNFCHLDENTDKNIASGWISKHLQNQEANSETPLQMYVFDKDDLNVKSVQIPTDFSAPYRTRQFQDLTEEENNFLGIVYALTPIVYTVIKDEFKTKCSNDELGKFCMEIYEQQHTRVRKKSREDKNQSKTIYLTQKQQAQLFSPKNEESRNLDLKLMIYILKRKNEEEGQTEYVNQLNIIDNIRREIVKSSSGILNEERFEDILRDIKKAIVHFGEELYKEQLLTLQHIRNIQESL